MKLIILDTDLDATDHVCVKVNCPTCGEVWLQLDRADSGYCYGCGTLHTLERAA